MCTGATKATLGSELRVWASVSDIRPAKPRTKLYGEVPEERQQAAAVSDGHLPELLPVLD